MRVVPRLLYVLVPAAAVILLSGCTQLDLKKPLTWPLSSEDKPGTPNRIVSFWKDTVLYKPGQRPLRGFGGRLMFYNIEEDKPIKVDGSVVVYAFDETRRAPTNAKPDRKFVFPRESFNLHYSESALGHSYSVWIPWDEVGGEQKEISLIVRFLPAEGAPLIGDQTKHVLPGKQPAAALAQKAPQTPDATRQVQPVSYDSPTANGQAQAAEQKAPAERMSSTTIPIPSRFGRQRPVATVTQPVHNPMVPYRQNVGHQAPTVPAAASQSFPQQARPARRGFQPRQGSLRPRARFSPAISRPPAVSVARPAHDRSQWQRLPATSPSAPGSPLPPAPGSAPGWNATGAGPAPY